MNIPTVPKGFLPSSLFSDRIFSEFVSGSAIDPNLFGSSITIVQDTEVSAGGEVSYPIHDSLNWRMTRFGQQARLTLEAALFQNEDGTIWQAKLSTPIDDSKKGKPRKYETPVGSGSRAFFPNQTRKPDRASKTTAQPSSLQNPAFGTGSRLDLKCRSF